MSVTFNSFAKDVGNQRVRVLYYEADRSDIIVDKVDANTADSWIDENNGNGRFGINGTFYNSNGTSVGFAVNNAGYINSGVRNYEDTDWSGNYYRPFSCFFNLKQMLSSGRVCGVATCKGTYPFTHNGDTIELSNTEYCIGGLNLYIGDTSITDLSKLVAKTKADVDAVTPTNWQRTYGYDLDFGNSSSSHYNTACTILGYKAPGKVVLAVFLNDSNRESRAININMFDVRKILTDDINCTMAISLDGGSSTQISFKTSGGTKGYYRVGSKNHARTRVRLTDNASITWNWNGAT